MEDDDTAAAATRPGGIPPRLLRRISLYSGRLSTEAVKAMSERLDFFVGLGANQRADVQLMVQSAIQNFVEWIRVDDGNPTPVVDLSRLPSDLSRSLTFKQTVDLLRTAMEFFETWVPLVTRDDDLRTSLNAAVLRYSREIGFMVAAAYAVAAESRGAWDTRLEAMVVDSVIRGETGPGLLSQASALGWAVEVPAIVVVGEPHPDHGVGAPHHVHAVASAHERPALAVTQGNLLMCIIGGEPDRWDACLADLLGAFADAPVVVGPRVPSLAGAHHSAREALASIRAVPGWTRAPRPVSSAELLPERVLLGDPAAEEGLLTGIVEPLRAAGSSLVETLDAYLEAGGHVEACARHLYVHPNTVRYRLKRVLHITRLDPLTARDRFVLKVSITLGKLRDHATTTAQQPHQSHA